jgi:LysM repeat protein
MRRALVVIVLLVLALSFATPVMAWGGGTVHIVHPGETLFSIGRWYGVNPWAIARANGLVNPNYIWCGQRLVIPTGYGCCGGWPTYNVGYRYVVRCGDTLTSIAWRHGVDVWSLAQANGIYNLNCIYTGQVLYIPGW